MCVEYVQDVMSNTIFNNTMKEVQNAGNAQ